MKVIDQQHCCLLQMVVKIRTTRERTTSSSAVSVSQAQGAEEVGASTPPSRCHRHATWSGLTL